MIYLEMRGGPQDGAYLGWQSPDSPPVIWCECHAPRNLFVEAVYIAVGVTMKAEYQLADDGSGYRFAGFSSSLAWPAEDLF